MTTCSPLLPSQHSQRSSISSITTASLAMRSGNKSFQPLFRHKERSTDTLVDLTSYLEAFHQFAGLVPLIGYQIQATVTLGQSIIRIIMEIRGAQQMEYDLCKKIHKMLDILQSPDVDSLATQTITVLTAMEDVHSLLKEIEHHLKERTKKHSIQRFLTNSSHITVLSDFDSRLESLLKLISMKFVVQTHREVIGNKEEHKEIHESVLESKRILSLDINKSISEASLCMEHAINEIHEAEKRLGENLKEMDASIKGIQTELQRLRSQNSCQNAGVERTQPSFKRRVVSWKPWRFRTSFSKLINRDKLKIRHEQTSPRKLVSYDQIAKRNPYIILDLNACSGLCTEFPSKSFPKPREPANITMYNGLVSPDYPNPYGC